MKRLRGVTERLKSARAYSHLADRSLDRINLALLGLFNAKINSKSGFVSRVARGIGRPVVVRPQILGGLAILVDPRDTSHMDIFNEVILENAYDLTLVPFEPDLVIDCGGHIGLFTVLVASRFLNAKIMVFEPNPKNLQLIQRTARINRMTASIRPEAVSDRCGKQVFYERNSCGGSLSTQIVGIHQTYPVEVIDLVSLLKELSPQRLLLKMDIEGEEENLLPKLASIFPRVCAIYFETHRFEDGWKLVRHSLIAEGFEVTLLRDRDRFRDGFAVRVL